MPGIYPINYAPLGIEQQQVITTQWRDTVNGEQTYVYAGAYKEVSVGDSGAVVDTSRGLILVQVFSADLSNMSDAFYDAPGVTGILTITAAAGNRLTLSSASGATLYFDVVTRTFVGGMSETATAPTITALPPRSATPDLPTITPITPGAGYPGPEATATPPLVTPSAVATAVVAP